MELCGRLRNLEVKIFHQYLRLGLSGKLVTELDILDKERAHQSRSTVRLSPLAISLTMVYVTTISKASAVSS